MSTANEALNLLAQIIAKAENQILTKANFVNELQEKKARMDIVERQSYELANMINDHEALQEKFADLLTFLETIFENANQAQKIMQQALFELEHIKLINKDVLHHKKQADYWKSCCKLFVVNQKTLEEKINKLENAKNQQFG